MKEEGIIFGILMTLFVEFILCATFMWGYHANAQTLGSDTVGYECPFTLSVNLSEGMTSIDVQHLQQVLNIDPSTQVAASGSGSPGEESEYFGALTFAAVERFQEKYAQNILFPVGLKTPTGYVGLATRSWFNAICGV